MLVTAGLFSSDQWRSSSPAVMLGTALLLAVVAFVIWKKCYAQPLQTATTTGQPEHQPRAHFLSKQMEGH